MLTKCLFFFALCNVALGVSDYIQEHIKISSKSYFRVDPVETKQVPSYPTGQSFRLKQVEQVNQKNFQYQQDSSISKPHFVKRDLSQASPDDSQSSSFEREIRPKLNTPQNVNHNLQRSNEDDISADDEDYMLDDDNFMKENLLVYVVNKPSQGYDADEISLQKIINAPTDVQDENPDFDRKPENFRRDSEEGYMPTNIKESFISRDAQTDLEKLSRSKRNLQSRHAATNNIPILRNSNEHEIDDALFPNNGEGDFANENFIVSGSNGVDDDYEEIEIAPRENNIMKDMDGKEQLILNEDNVKHAENIKIIYDHFKTDDSEPILNRKKRDSTLSENIKMDEGQHKDDEKVNEINMINSEESSRDQSRLTIHDFGITKTTGLDMPYPGNPSNVNGSGSVQVIINIYAADPDNVSVETNRNNRDVDLNV